MVVMYLDDVWVWVQNRDTCARSIQKTCTLLEKSGFIINREKLQLTPQQKV